MSFHAQLDRSWTASRSMLCVGLDPDPAPSPRAARAAGRTPSRSSAGRSSTPPPTSCARSSRRSPTSPARARSRRWSGCASTSAATYPDVTLVLDAKRGDIGSTAEHYAREAFVRYGAHAVTVNPYLGTDSVEPLLRSRRRGHRPVPHEQPRRRRLPVADLGRPAALRARRRHGRRRSGRSSATAASSSAPRTRASWPTCGRSRRRADPRARRRRPGRRRGIGRGHGATHDGRGLVVSSSRAMLYASDGTDFADAARAEAERTAASLRLRS